MPRRKLVVMPVQTLMTLKLAPTLSMVDQPRLSSAGTEAVSTRRRRRGGEGDDGDAPCS